MAEPWIGESAVIDLMKATSSTQVARWGKRSESHWPEVPYRLKFQRGFSKFAVRKAMDRVMPDKLRLRTTKLGFASPDRVWLATDLRGPVTELLNGPMRSAKYVDPAALRRWYGSEQAKKANTDSYLGLFRVLSLEMWMRAFNLN